MQLSTASLLMAGFTALLLGLMILQRVQLMVVSHLTQFPTIVPVLWLRHGTISRIKSRPTDAHGEQVDIHLCLSGR